MIILISAKYLSSHQCHNAANECLYLFNIMGKTCVCRTLVITIWRCVSLTTQVVYMLAVHKIYVAIPFGWV